MGGQTTDEATKEGIPSTAMRRLTVSVSSGALASLALVLSIGLMASCAGGPAATPPAPTALSSPSPVPSAAPPELVPLPGMASDPELAPEIPLIVLLSRSLEADIAGWWRLDGQLANVGQAPARDVAVVVRFYDAAGLLLDTRAAVVGPQALLPGKQGHYGLIWPPDPRIARVTVQPTWKLLPLE